MVIMSWLIGDMVEVFFKMYLNGYVMLCYDLWYIGRSFLMVLI